MSRYWHTHCDKANNNDYDIAVLLYLNSDFNGGRFVFVDEDTDYFVKPQTGRVLMFPSSTQNIHRVEKVTRGDRFLLSMWFKLVTNNTDQVL